LGILIFKVLYVMMSVAKIMGATTWLTQFACKKIIFSYLHARKADTERRSKTKRLPRLPEITPLQLA
jgi:hypothetical protein